MGVRRQNGKFLPPSKTDAGEPPIKPHKHHYQSAASTHTLSLYLTNGLFFSLFFSVAYFLLHRWRDKIRNSMPLHVISLSELAAVASLVASFVYLLGFFGFLDLFQSPTAATKPYPDDTLDDVIAPCAAATDKSEPPPISPNSDEEIVDSVVSGKMPSYSLESRLGDCRRAAAIRREALERITGKSLTGLPLDGFDYESILGQCCEMPVGYVQIPVGIAGPLLLDGKEFSVPMATTEGCLVASTNRGCKAMYLCGGATSVVLRDGMTRAPVVRFGTAKRASELKFYLEDPENFDTLAVVFNKSSRFGRLQGIQCAIAGKNVYMRFRCSTGDAMGMNMVSKGVQNVLDFLQNDFSDMDVIGISGNFCSDKKPAAVNWIEGRGKSVVCEAIIKEEVVNKVLKTNVAALVELNMLKNLTGSAMAGALGGFNAHTSNIVSAVYIATGQDPAQNVESSHCITMMEAVNDGKDLHISVTMPSIEVGTVGGGTQLASQSACLNLLGVKGASKDSPGSNSRLLASIVAGAVLAGELSLMSALAAGQLVNSHMKYNRSSKDVTKVQAT
ncbi:3-hydroxy-3-methylglutaryl coenzyme A reductase 2-B-like [Actinidia eriantha]|uniref:3-hydroxy-3-methylglutaryl coenzyme A reductase 2-B-like n=1 Tax=Actinidia eriantha TaxID=165200 RepID=UPI0025827404|nr:3-hydroxy-3-methylglutaryl coenzyme A reductase 2-B-like [Actinidia eriantha]